MRRVETRRLSLDTRQHIEALDAHPRLHHGGKVVFQKLHRLRHALQGERHVVPLGRIPRSPSRAPSPGEYGQTRFVRTRENTA